MTPTRISLVIAAMVIAAVGGLFLWKLPHLTFYYSDLNRPTAVMQVEQIQGISSSPEGWHEIEFVGQRSYLPEFVLSAGQPRIENQSAYFGHV